MLSLGAIAFVEPAILAALLVLPLIWWLLRLLPPAPRRLRFPAIRLLFGLRQEDETPDRTPVWLLLLRLALAGALIVGLAHPLLHPSAGLPGSGPLLIVVDDGWGAARHWAARRQALADMIEHARRDHRPVALVTTAPPPTGDPLAPPQLVSAVDALRSARALEPRPWPPDYKAAIAAAERAALPRPIEVVWLADGLAERDAFSFAERLQRFGSLTVLTDPSGGAAHLIRAPVRGPGGLEITLERAPAPVPDAVPVRLLASDDRLLGRLEMRFASGEARATGKIELPGELLNEGAMLRLDGEASAGGVFLLDDAWRRRQVGIAAAAPSQAGHPLLEALHYLDAALAGVAESRHGPIRSLIEGGPSLIVLTDENPPTPEERRQLRAWVEAGGLLIRFAGPHMTEVPDDDLLPVTLRRASRTLGGPLSWEKPQNVAPFPPESPFAGLAVPSDVTVSRQVLAEPAPDLGHKTWATLVDGTPLVTSAAVGQGRIVLFHVSAGPDWSNLPISGLFPEMLQRLAAVSRASQAAEGNEALAPLQSLDGLGRLGQPAAAARAVSAADLPKTVPSPAHPPGYYGPAASRRALNLGTNLPALAALDRLPSGVAHGTFGETAEVDLKPPLLLIATLLLLADLVASLWLRGHMPRLRRRAAAAAVAALALVAAGRAHAADVPEGPDQPVIQATIETHLAYVLTGNRDVDETSRAGMVGLSQVLARRTSVEPGAPTAIDIERDEIIFYPLLYWPIDSAEPPLSDAAKARIANFLETGGTILFDTRDQEEVGSGLGGSTPQRQHLRELTDGLPIPPLAPIPPDHVLTRAFYLIHGFPGRWSGGTLWVEPQSAARLDGVPTVMVGSNDWAAAWAIDESGRPLFPTVPGGEPQREAAYRFGVNLVMHVLTGNYKADQVHVPALLRRLGE